MEDLKKLRDRLDKIDEKIIKLLSKRFLITKKIGIYKKRYKLKSRDEKREKEIIARLKILAKSLGINPSLISKIYKLIFDEVVKNHQKIKNGKKQG